MSCPLTDRVIDLLAALVAGYTEALRHRIFDQQEEVKQALLKAQRDIERDLQASEARFREVFNCSAVGIAISDPVGRIVEANHALVDILGYRPGELSGLELGELFSPQDWPALQQRYQRVLVGQDLRFRMQLRLQRTDGETAWAFLAVSALCDEDQAPRYLVSMVEDITELHLLQEQLAHQALHDLETGLPNRHYFISQLEQVLGRLDQSAGITLLQLDLDGFSVINDGLGLGFGDRVLDMVARRPESVLADQQAMLARLGGDEFAILIEHGEQVLDVGRLAETINASLAEPIYLDELAVTLTASIGVVQRRAGGVAPGELLRAAGATLRRLRGRGARQWALFNAQTDAADRSELRLAAAIGAALDNGELRVDYQPVVALDSGRLVALEAVLSWQHPELDLLSHQRCVQLAEQTGVVAACGHGAGDAEDSWPPLTREAAGQSGVLPAAQLGRCALVSGPARVPRTASWR